MLDRMSDEDRGELGNMISGLFDLYNMDDLAMFVPSTWKTTYISPDGRSIQSQVKIVGTRGTYNTSDGRTHSLENVDIAYSRTEEAKVISGIWRFAPGTPQESSGKFRWKISDNDDAFSGNWERIENNVRRTREWQGTLLSGPFDGQ
jgi:hypothetical protein